MWRQLLVKVGIGLPPVYLDTSQQELLYAPLITAVDLNVATQFHLEAPPQTQVAHEQAAIGPLSFRNRVTPAAVPTFVSASNSPESKIYDVVFQGSLNTEGTEVFTDSGPGFGGTFFAIYANDPNHPDKRIYLRPTTPEHSGEPRKNQILGHELEQKDFESSENYVFLNGPTARPTALEPPRPDTETERIWCPCCTIL